MTVTEAVRRRYSARAFKPDPVPGALVREILEIAQRSPSGGNLQPWRTWALADGPLDEFRAEVAARIAAGEMNEPREYTVYPENLWEPHRTHRFQGGEDLYASIGIAREDKFGRLAQFANNYKFFGAPVGLFFCLDRRMGPPQWADLGMYMQTVMLLAAERGLDTCAQEAWSVWPRTVARFLDLPPELMVFSGMALGYGDETHPINSFRTRREPPEDCITLRGFDD